MSITRWQLALRIVGLGWYVAFCILGGVLGGIWMDRRFDLLPLFTLIGLLVGIIVAFLGLYRMLQPLLSQNWRQTDSKWEM